MSIHNIIKEVQETQGTNAKIALLKTNSVNDLLKRTVKMTLDKVAYSYGIKKIPEVSKSTVSCSLDEFLDFLEFKLVTRELTGGKATEALSLILSRLSPEDLLVAKLVINRDLKCGIGRTQANLVWHNLIIKPSCMRCEVFSNKNAGRISYPALIQEKCDGRYVSVLIDAGNCTFTSRSGEEQEFQELAKIFSKYPDGVYMGALLISGEPSRAISNGMINSSNPPEDKIYCVLWDVVSSIGFAHGSPIPYEQRFNLLNTIVNSPVNDKVQVVDCKIVHSSSEALQYASDIMGKGGEGAVLKDYKLPFKNHISPLQLKIKLAVDITVKIVGFTEGTKGTSRESTFGAIKFTTDDLKIQGKTSGFTDEMLEDFNSRRDELIGTFMDVTFNDLTKSVASDTYSLSHPRFLKLRSDKTETDSFERVLEIIEAAKGL